MSEKITGYRELTEGELTAINGFKMLEIAVNDCLAELDEDPNVNQRHLAIARTHIETGFMFAVKAIAKPFNK